MGTAYAALIRHDQIVKSWFIFFSIVFVMGLGRFAFAQPLPEMQQSETNGLNTGSVSPIDVSSITPVTSTSGWQIALPGNRPVATPAVVNGTVYVGGGFGSYEFYAFDATTGAPTWGIRVSDDGPTAAVVSDGYVTFNTESCTLFNVRAQDGSLVWAHWLGDPLMSQPAISDGRVFMVYPAVSSHFLVAFDLEVGNRLWEVPIDTDAITAPVVIDSEVFVATHSGRVFSFDTITGTQRWVEDYQATSAPWIRGDRVFVSMHDETATDTETPVEGLVTLSRDSGIREQSIGDSWGRVAAPWLSAEVQRESDYADIQTNADSLVGFGGGAPVVARLGEATDNIGLGTVHGMWEYQGSRPALVGDILIATMGDTVRATNAENGEELWTYRLPGDVNDTGGHLGTPPAIAGGRAYVATSTGRLFALAPESGEVLWQHDLSMPIRHQPAIVDGRIYLGTTTGQLVMVDTGHRDGGDWTMWGGGPTHMPIAD